MERAARLGRAARPLIVGLLLVAGSAPPTLAGGVEPGSADRTSLALEARYEVTLRLDFGTRALRVWTDIDVTNRSGGPIDRLELNTVAARLGRIRLGSVTVDGRPVRPTVDDQTISVPLGGILADGASTAVHLVYSATLRATTGGSDWLFARANGIAALYRWIPWVSRHRAFDRPNHGDPFVTPVSPSVRYRIITDRPLRIATNGRRVEASADGRTQVFLAEQVRDVPITASPDYRITTGTVGDTTVRVFTRPGAPSSTMLAWAKRAVGRMEPLVGEYPYRTLVVAQSAGGYAMEGPGVIWLPYGLSRERIPYLASHEVAHQWFYGLVGNDQATQPFADEASAEFLARYTLASFRASRCSATRLDLSIYRYSAACYFEVVYVDGARFLDGVRRRIGDRAFWGAMRDYLAANRWGIAGTRKLLDAIDARTPEDLVPRYRPRFPGLYPAG